MTKFYHMLYTLIHCIAITSPVVKDILLVQNQLLFQSKNLIIHYLKKKIKYKQKENSLRASISPF